MKITLFLSLLAILTVGCATSDYTNVRDGRGQKYVDPRFMQGYVSVVDGVGRSTLPEEERVREYHYRNFGNSAGFGYQQGSKVRAFRVNTQYPPQSFVVVETYVQPPVQYYHWQPYPCYNPQVYMPPMIMPGFGLRNDFPGLSR